MKDKTHEELEYERTHSVTTITMRDYDNLPIIYDDDGNFDRNLALNIGDRFRMRESDDYYDKGSVVSVYEVIRVTDRGYESKISTLRIE